MSLDDLTHAHAATSRLLAALGPGGWHRSTPCPGWDVADVVRHLTVGDRAFTISLGGRPYDLTTLTAELAPVAPTDLPAAYDASAVRLRAALAAADPVATFPTGIGPMPVGAVTELRIIESLTHGWDVSQGTGIALDVDDAVAERAIRHSRALMERLPTDRTPFGPPQPIADTAPALNRLVALLGRAVGG